MKKIMLFGDSIRLGYQETVREQLKDLAGFRSPGVNCGNSNHVREHLHEWMRDVPVDLIHINCGLHDLRRERGERENAVPAAAYGENLRWIFDQLRTRTGAEIFWATTTPVNQEWHNRVKDFERYLDDVIAYNTLACSIAAEFGIEVNPLYAAVESVGRDSILLEDGVHYTPDGYAYLGGKVAAFIRERLG